MREFLTLVGKKSQCMNVAIFLLAFLVEDDLTKVHMSIYVEYKKLGKFDDNLIIQ